MKILVVDDEKNIRDLFTKVCRFALPDCRIDLAVNGAEAVDAFREGRYDIILMDLYMPVMDGFEAFREIQALCSKEGVEMPAFIFCTGYAVPDELTELIAETPRHCLLQKPISTEILLNALMSRL